MKLVIFDCDGTLVDSQHVILSAMGQAFELCGLPVPEDEAIRSIIGLSMVEAMTRLRPGIEDAEVERLIHAYRQAWAERDTLHEPMFDGAEETVRSLAARDDVLLGIATGKSQRGVRRLLAEKGLEGCFVTIQTADDAPSKPHPGMILRALEATGAPLDTATMIGDTVFDIEMAVNAGVHPIGVDWGYHPQDHLLRAGARHMVRHFNELEPLLESVWQSFPATARFHMTDDDIG